MDKANLKQKSLSYADWLRINHSYLKTELALLRLILQRRILWLRKQWKEHDPLQNYHGQVISDAWADWLLTAEDRRIEQRFYIEDNSAQKTTRAINKTKRELKNQSDTLIESGTPTTLDRITQILGLSLFDRTILLLCLAPELDSAFERLYAYIQDDVTLKYATPHLALSLFSENTDSEYEMKQSFLPESLLSKYKLIERKNLSHQAHSLTACPLRINSRIADYLQGINRLDENAADILKPVPRVESLPHSYEEIFNKLKRLIKTNNVASPLPVINLTGPSISGKRDIASKLCEVLGIELYRLNTKQLHSSELKWNDITSILERECLLLPAALYIDTLELENDNDPSKPFLFDLIEKLRTFFIVFSKESLHCERELLNVYIPKLNPKEQSTLWKQQLGTHGVSMDGQIDELVEQFDFEPDMIAKTITAAISNTRMKKGKNSCLSQDDIWTACRDQSRNDLDGCAQRIVPCFTWEDIVLPEDTQEELKDIAAQVAYRALVYGEWGFGAKMSRGRGISALFSGPSGTGKTMAAEILANHLNLDLYRIDLSAVVSKYIGETEKNLRKVFDAAEQSGAILFFDEADALFGKRSEVKDSHDRYANIEVNYLLQRMEDYRGLAILATNMKSLLDPAFLRRLRFHVEFPFPDTSARQRIWQKSFPPKMMIKNLDYCFLSRLEIPGGNIKNIALNAAFLAADNGYAIEMDHILRATKREYTKIGKMVLESEFGDYYEKVKL